MQREGYRKAESMWMDQMNPLVRPIVERVSELLECPIENQEPPHVVRYEVGGEYKLHHDFFHLGEDYTEEMMKYGGQREATFLIYLNDNFEGGETDFPKFKLTIKPKTGNAIIWNNVTEDKKLDKKSIHAGLPVINGSKYILVIWIRESAFNKPAEHPLH